MRATIVALLVALFLPVFGGARATAQKRATQTQVNRAIDKGVEYLVGIQLPDGSFPGGYDRYRAGFNSLVLYTLLKCDVPADHQAVRRSIRHILDQPIEDRTYSLGCVLMALVELDRDKYRKRIHELAERLLDWQRPLGYWAYPDQGPDLSNTQYALLGLLAASKAGFKVPIRPLEKLARALGKEQGGYGDFDYRPTGEGHATGSMTAAGGGCLGILLKLMQKNRKASPRLRNEIKGRLARTLRWFASHFSPRSNPQPANSKSGHTPAHFYYYLYGVERLGAFTGVNRFGAHDWYWEGATELVKRQNLRRGHWPKSGLGNTKETCFALLFLRRATSPTTDFSRSGVEEVKTKGADFFIRGEGGDSTAMWVSRWPARLTGFFGWQDGKIRVAWVRWLANGKPIGQVPGNAKEPMTLSRNAFAYKRKFDENGAYTLEARALVVDEDGLETTLKSNRIRVVVDSLVTPAIRQWLQLAGTNYLSPGFNRMERTVEASTHTKGKGPGKALDGRCGTAWQWRADDARPALRIRLAKTVRATHLGLVPAIKHPLGFRDWARPRQVEIKVGKRVFTVTLPDRPTRTIIDFGKSIPARTLQVTVLGTYPGKGKNGVGGLAEIELFNARRKRPR